MVPARRWRQRTVAVIVAALAAMSGAVATTAAAQDGPIINAGAPEAIKDNYLVALKKTVSPQALDSSVNRLADRHDAKLKDVFRYTLPGFSATMSQEQAKRLAAEPDVAYVEQDQVMHADATAGPTGTAGVTETAESAGLDRIDQRRPPLDGQYTYDTTASNVTAYVIDSGIRITHNEFGGRAGYGRDTVNDDNVASDCTGHGTAVAGTIGGATFGVAKRVKLVAVRVLNCQNDGTTSTYVKGVEWVTAHHATPAVANMSIWGGASTMLDNAIKGSIAAGVTYALIAGNNNGKDACNYSPSRVNEGITVASTSTRLDFLDSRSTFSNIGRCVDIFAPGENIETAGNADNIGRATYSGTSFAAPHVAGAAALYLAKKPNATPAQVREVLFENATFGALTDIGAGSPNRLLIRPYGPVITNFSCNSIENQVSCSLQQAFGTSPVVRWFTTGENPDLQNQTSMLLNCLPGTFITVRATVTATNGSTEANWRDFCQGNG